ncbi:MAG: molecular chaperone DnaJ [Roseiflexaceae bacterium]|nr:molecular chaperone DnaJ [Roseiflexaceae bacterium]
MTASFNELNQVLRRATRAFEVFGPLDGAAALRRRFRELVRVIHPDHNLARVAEATAAFQALQRWLRAAEQELACGSYGQPAGFVVERGSRRYVVDGEPVQGELAELFPASLDGARVLLKVARHERDFDLMQAEATALRRLARALDGQPVRAHFPTLIEQFQLTDGSGARRTTNVLLEEGGTLTLETVVHAQPGGLHPADAAWIFNRMLAALAVAHDQGLVHGAVLLPHVLIRPADHNAVLIDWCYSVECGATIRSASPAWRGEYPPEVLGRQPASPATDIFMAARCVVRLLGGGDDVANLPASVPPAMRRLLQACLLPAPARRPNDAWQLFDDFNTILHACYGPPVFRPFVLP